MKPLLKVVIIIYLLASVVYSVKRQHYFTIDGDLPAIAMPVQSYQAVLKDPFGLNVLLHDSFYCATNRFFIHWSMYHYFRSFPKVLQLFLSPIDSVYYACAIAKTFFQFFLIYLFGVYSTNRKNLLDEKLLLVCALVTPLFQLYGFSRSMGIIGSSITYSFFYPFALSLVLLFFLPFFRSIFWNEGFAYSKWKIFFLMVLAVVLSFNGALNGPVCLIICPIVLLVFMIRKFKESAGHKFFRRIITSIKKIPSELIFIFGFVIALCLYSYYVGTHNSENNWETLSLSKRYSLLPHGIFLQLTIDAGIQLLLLIIIINSVLIKMNCPEEERKKYFWLLKWIGVLSIIYLLLLPLGGYRSSRPDIVRYDTFMPVTFALILFYALSTYHLISQTVLKRNKIYITTLLVFSFIFIYNDLKIEKENKCEKELLKEIAASSDTLILLSKNCPVLDWGLTLDYHISESKGGMLQVWGITRDKKLYYHK